jgi:hypothetical protein
MIACGRQAASSSEAPTTSKAPPLPPDGGDDSKADAAVTAEDPADVMAVDEAGSDEMGAMMRVGGVRMEVDEARARRLTTWRPGGRTPPHPRPPLQPRRLRLCPRPCRR